jgi:histidine triad (HIT) family protein
MNSIFSKIIRREIPAYIVAENEQFLAFLDVFPIREGHVLVVPKLEVNKWYDLPESLLQEKLVIAQPIAKAIEECFPCNRCGISIIGLEVPHAHLHLVPIDTADDLNFTRQKLKCTPEELAAIHDTLKSALKNG